MLPRSAPSSVYAAIFVPVEPTSIPIRLKNPHAPAEVDEGSSDKSCVCVEGVAYRICTLKIDAIEIAWATGALPRNGILCCCIELKL